MVCTRWENGLGSQRRTPRAGAAEIEAEGLSDKCCSTKTSHHHGYHFIGKMLSRHGWRLLPGTYRISSHITCTFPPAQNQPLKTEMHIIIRQNVSPRVQKCGGVGAVAVLSAVALGATANSASYSSLFYRSGGEG